MPSSKPAKKAAPAKKTAVKSVAKKVVKAPAKKAAVKSVAKKVVKAPAKKIPAKSVAPKVRPKILTKAELAELAERKIALAAELKMAKTGGKSS
ncbi:MAG: hypothetical protein WCI68_04525, partial [Actinomycetes bacterium]